MTPELELLYQALEARYGIVVKVSDFQLASQRLYAARRKADDTELNQLQFRRSIGDPEGELWITHAPRAAPTPETEHSGPPNQ